MGRNSKGKCRCKEIKELKEMLDKLMQFKGLIAKLSEDDHIVQDNLDKLADETSAAFIVRNPWLLSERFRTLNDTSTEAIAAMEEDIRPLIREVKKLLDKAIKEDMAYHKTHKSLVAVVEPMVIGGLD